MNKEHFDQMRADMEQAVKEAEQRALCNELALAKALADVRTLKSENKKLETLLEEESSNTKTKK